MKPGDTFISLGHRFEFIEFVGEKQLRARNLHIELIAVINTPHEFAGAQREYVEKSAVETCQELAARRNDMNMKLRKKARVLLPIEPTEPRSLLRRGHRPIGRRCDAKNLSVSKPCDVKTSVEATLAIERRLMREVEHLTESTPALRKLRDDCYGDKRAFE